MKLSHLAERLFWRLITVADDFGRFEADVDVVRAACFPRQFSTISVDEVASCLQMLADVGICYHYEIEGKMYGCFAKWDKHQYRRAKRSKHPAPPSASICSHLQADSFEDRGSRNEERDIEDRGFEAAKTFVSQMRKRGV